MIMSGFNFPVHGPESQYNIQNNNFRKRLKNTQTFAFDFVAFLVSLSTYVAGRYGLKRSKGFSCICFFIFHALLFVFFLFLLMSGVVIVALP